MTAHAPINEAITPPQIRGPLGALRAALIHTGEVLASASGAMRCAREAERLMQLPDAELARLGLSRDRIVQHAFARYLAD